MASDETVNVAPDTPLLWTLRDVIGLTGTKFGCGIAQCGACTVHVDGQPVRSCLLPVGSIGDRKVTTIEGISATEAGGKIEKAWLDLEVPQCGYCQSGQIMSAAALLAKTPDPNDADIDAAMAGNICRCGTYCASAPPSSKLRVRREGGLPMTRSSSTRNAHSTRDVEGDGRRGRRLHTWHLHPAARAGLSRRSRTRISRRTHSFASTRTARSPSRSRRWKWGRASTPLSP